MDNKFARRDKQMNKHSCSCVCSPSLPLFRLKIMTRN